MQRCRGRAPQTDHSGPEMTHLMAPEVMQNRYQRQYLALQSEHAHLSLLVLACLRDLEGLESVGKLESMSDERLQVDEASRDKRNSHRVVAWTVSDIFERS